jgi:hypothetical protein
MQKSIMQWVEASHEEQGRVDTLEASDDRRLLGPDSALRKETLTHPPSETAADREKHWADLG